MFEFKVGDCVRLKSEFCTPSEIERADIYVVVDVWQNSGQSPRAAISCVTTGRNQVIKPVETVGLEMIQLIT